MCFSCKCRNLDWSSTHSNTHSYRIKQKWIEYKWLTCLNWSTEIYVFFLLFGSSIYVGTRTKFQNRSLSRRSYKTHPNFLINLVKMFFSLVLKCLLMSSLMFPMASIWAETSTYFKCKTLMVRYSLIILICWQKDELFIVSEKIWQRNTAC